MQKKLLKRYFKNFIKSCQFYQLNTRRQGLYHLTFNFNYLNTPEKNKVYSAIDTIKNSFKHHEVKIHKGDIFPYKIEIMFIYMYEDINNNQHIISSIKKSFNKKTLKIKTNNLDTSFIVSKYYAKEIIKKIKDNIIIDYGALISVFELFLNDKENRTKALSKFNAKQIFRNVEGRGIPIDDSNYQLFIDLIKIDPSIIDVLRSYEILIKDSNHKRKILSYFL